MRVNMKKTKFLISGVGLNLLQDSGEFPCAICRSGVGVNSIECSQCKLWVHKKCSGLTGRLVADPEFVCQRCRGVACPIDGRPVTHVDVDGTQLDVEATFCYLGDMLTQTHFTFLPFIHVRSVRALEGEVASVEENMAACTDAMSMKDSIIQSLTLQLAELQDGASGTDGGVQKNGSRSADAIVETARDLERLTVPICAAFIVLFLFCVYFVFR